MLAGGLQRKTDITKPSMSLLPLVSFIIVAKNSAEYLPGILSDILLQDYPVDRLELLLIDGRSTDSTRYIMENFAKAHKVLNVKVLDNPEKILPCGWNLALAEAKGDIILHVDAHSSIPKDFITKNVKNILSGEDIVGGQRITIMPSGIRCSILAIAERSKFGSGAAEFRNPGVSRYVDTLAHAAYKRSVFANVGGYDERLVRNQDVEIHYRMKKVGFRFFFDPKVKSSYISRSTLYGLLKQKYATGLWIGLIMGVQPRCFGLRHFVPALFVAALIIGFILVIIWSWLPIVLLGVLYASGVFTFTFEAIIKAQFRLKPFCILLPIVFFLTHLIYGIGTWIGLVKMPFFIWKNRSYKMPRPITR